MQNSKLKKKGKPPGVSETEYLLSGANGKRLLKSVAEVKTGKLVVKKIIEA